jgi:hypothetical protein
MAHWEYMPLILTADLEIGGARELIRKNWPEWIDLPAHPVQSLAPLLNRWGAEGWELVHMEPVGGANAQGQVLFPGDHRVFSQEYFCVFKRRLEER